MVKALLPFFKLSGEGRRVETQADTGADRRGCGVLTRPRQPERGTSDALKEDREKDT